MSSNHGSAASLLHQVPTPAVDRLTIAQAIRDAMRDEMERDPSVLVLGEDVGVDGGVFRATDGLLEQFGPQRVIDTPLSESAIIGTAVGLAATGFKPVTEIQFMGFIYPGVNQLLAHAARLRNRTRGRITVPMVVRTPAGGGIHAPEHHSESYESMLLNSPGVKVVFPSNPRDAKGLLTAAIRDPDPVVFMEPTRIYRAFREEVPREPFTVPLGVANVAREGRDVTLISWGAMVRVCLDAADALGRDGVTAEVVDLRTLNPLDRDTVLASVRKTGRAVVVHEAPLTNGFGGEIAALIGEHCLLDLEAPVQRVAGYDTVMPLPRLENVYLPSRDRIVRAARAALEFKTMAFVFQFPDVGEGIHEGRLVEWLVAEGAIVAEDQGLCKVETDKAVVELPSPRAGAVLTLHVAAGDTIHVGDPLVTIGADGEVAPSHGAAVVDRPAPALRETVPAARPGGGNGHRPPATPRTRALARRLGVDLGAVKGSGRGGRITDEDVERTAAGAQAAPPAPVRPAAAAAPAAARETTADGPVERVPLSHLRKVIAIAMRESKHTSAHVTHVDEADVTELLAAHRRVKARIEADGGVRFTLLPFFIKALVEVLKRFPAFNASVDEARGELVLKRYYNIGIAVDTPEGLIVPVLKGADRKDMVTIAREVADLAERARHRRLSLDELRGGTCTLTNIGPLGGVFATPIIRQPELAIVGLHAIKERPAVVDGEIKIRSQMYLSVSFDHRYIDGADAARFMSELVRLVSEPSLLMVRL